MTFCKLGVLAAAFGLFLAVAVQAQDDSAREKAVADWVTSAHADAGAAAFTHWNKEGEISADCVACHAGAGFRTFHGLDGSAPGDAWAMPTDGVVDCDTCHVDGAMSIAEIRFPSGFTLEPLQGSATCYTCHQGR